MLNFPTNSVSNRITRIFAFGTELMYLIEGDNKNVLVDTGSGFGSLKKAVDDILTAHDNHNDLIVLVSHGHVDHAFGAAEFIDAGTPVYMSYKDKYIFSQHAELAFRKDGLSMEDFGGHGEYVEEEDFIPSPSFEDFKDIKDGDVFDLGGVKIEAFECKGHTVGSMVFLIHEDKKTYLFTGDACNLFTFVYDKYSTSIEEYEESLKALKTKIDGKYDEVLISHGNGVGYLGMVEDVIEVCEKIKNGTSNNIPFEFRGSHGMIAMTPNQDDMKGNIVFHPDRVWKKNTVIS